MFSDIIEGNYTGLPSKANFQKFLQQLMTDMECDNSRDNQLFNLGCGTEEARSSFTHYFLNQKFKSGHLSNIFSFFSKYIIANKNTLADKNIKNLISLGTHYTLLQDAKINNANSTFSENDVITSSEFLSFLTSLLNVHNITEFETQQLIHTKGEGLLPNITFGDDQKIDMLVGHTNKLVTDLMARLDLKNYLHKEESFLNSLESLGDLGFQLKLKEEFADQADQIKNIAQTILSSPSSRNFTETFKISAAWAFLNRYHDKNAHDIETDCRYLFGFENCLPPDNENTRIIYEKILKNTIKPADLNTINYQLVIDKLSQGTPENIANQLNSLSGNNKLTNCINFFKDYLKQNNNTLNEIYLKKTFKLCNAINEIATASKTSLRNTANKLDIKYFKMIQAQLALVLNLVKSNSEEKSLHDQIHSISQLENLVIDVIENYHDHKYSNKTDENVKNIPKSYLDIINYSKDSDSSLLVSSNSFAKSIKEVTKACLNSEACNNTEIKKQSFEMLGGMVRKLDQVHRIHLAKEVINSAKELKNIIKNNNNISDAELGSDVANFLRIRHARNRILMDKDCMDIFGLNPEDCRPFIASNATTIATRIIPETIINSTTISAPQIIANATIASAINQTDNFEPISTIYSDSISEVPTTTEIITDIVQNLGSQFPTITEVSTTSAHSLGSSLINLMTQGTSIWLRSKGYGESIISALSLSLAGGILQASYMATFPLMLYKLNELIASGNEQEAQEAWEMMTQEMLPTFFTSLSLSTGLQLLNYLSENYLSKQSMLKGLVQSIPTLSSLWSFSRNPILTGIHAATAYGVSAAGLFGFNRYWGARNRHADVEEAEQNGHEMQKLNDTKDIHPTANDIGTTELVISKKIPLFITDEQFSQIKNTSEKILNELAELVCSLEQIIENNRAEIKPYTLPDIANIYQKIIDDKSRLHSDLQEILKLKQYETSTKSIWKEIIEFLNDDHKDAHMEFVIKNIYTLDEIENVLQKVYKESANLESSDQPKIKHSFLKFTSEIETIKDYINSSQNLKNSSSNSDLIFTTNEKNIIQAMKKLIQQTSLSAIEKLGNVFKLLVPNFDDMKSTLSTSLGFVNGASSSFIGSDTLDKLTTISKDIKKLLDLTQIYLSKYNTSNAGNQGEQKGKILARTELFEKIAQNTTANTLRPKKARALLENRPQSMASDSRTYSSGSEADSAISTGSSKDEENAQILRPLL